MKPELIPYFLIAVPVLPLLASLINLFIFAVAQKHEKEKIQFIAIAVSILAVILALIAQLCVTHLHPPLLSEGSATIIPVGTWLTLGTTLRLDWSLRYDALTSVMVPLVLFISLMVQIFSIGYLADRRQDYARYFALLSFFVFSMLTLVVAGNLFVFFLGWESVGLSSYKLISFYVEKDAAQRAGKKAFIINRIGDAALLIAMFAIIRVSNSADFREIALAFSKNGIAAMHANFIALLIFIAAAAKSAQLPLYTWLPDAMTGPTPVSALIHAATMVTAGIFLMLRLEPVFLLAPEASQIVAYIGAITATIAAFVALSQTDIKKVLAFSTVSQLGLMVLAIGTGSFAAAFFHLFTHAFFKAMLFLIAGAVITYSHHEQNIRRMGGIARIRPALTILAWIGLAALAGLPGLSGFFSKDHILAGAFAFKAGGFVLGSLVLVTSLMTAFYSFRLGIIVFHGKPAQESHHSEHEPAVSFYIPLFILAIPAIFSGFVGIPDFFTGYESRFFEFLQRNLPINAHEFVSSIQTKLSHDQELKVIAAGIGVALLGSLAALIYFGVMKRRPVAEGAYRGMFADLSLNKLYLDEIYHGLVVKPYRAIGNWASRVESNILPAISEGVGLIAESISFIFARLQSGEFSHYAMFMFAGVIALICIVLGST